MSSYYGSIEKLKKFSSKPHWPFKNIKKDIYLDILVTILNALVKFECIIIK